jgi:hypothetical protein
MAKPGQKLIVMPDNFKSIYIDAKAENKSDVAIAKDLFVSRDTLVRWKKELGFEAWHFIPVPRNKKMPDNFKELYLSLKQQGLTDTQIAKEIKASKGSINRWKTLAGFTCGQFSKGGTNKHGVKSVENTK